MNKRIKNLISIGVLSITILLPVTSYANNSEKITEKLPSTAIENVHEENYILISNQKDIDYVILNKQTGEEITNVSEVIGGVARPLSAAEALTKLNNTFNLDDEINISNTQDTQIEQNEQSQVQPRIEYHFSRTSGPTLYTASPIKLSRDVEARYNPVQISIGSTYQKSVSATFSVSSQYEKNAITAGSTMGATWEKSATASVTTTHTVPKGKVGAVYLKPYKYNLKGNLTTMHSSGATTTKSVTSTSPKKILNGICDGLEYLSTKNI